MSFLRLFSSKVRIYVILGEWSMHLALIEAMYKSKLIGRSGTGSQNIKVGNQLGQGNEEPQYFVVGVEKDEWDIKGRNNDCIRRGYSLTKNYLTILVFKILFHFLFFYRSQ